MDRSPGREPSWIIRWGVDTVMSRTMACLLVTAVLAPWGCRYSIHWCSTKACRRMGSDKRNTHVPVGISNHSKRCSPRGCAAPGKVPCQGNTQECLSKLKATSSLRKIVVTCKSPVGDISAVTLIRTDTTLDHSQKAEKVCPMTLLSEVEAQAIWLLRHAFCRLHMGHHLSIVDVANAPL